MKILEWLFPPQLGRVKDLTYTKEYLYRVGRNGVENHPHMAVGVVQEPAKYKRIIELPGRVI